MKRREGATVLDMSRKQGMSGPVLRGEAQMRGRVLKIHPTVQTKGGMKKGRGVQDRRESECGGGGQDFRGEKKIVSLSSSPHSHPPFPPRSPTPPTSFSLSPLESWQKSSPGKASWMDGWMDGKNKSLAPVSPRTLPT